MSGSSVTTDLRRLDTFLEEVETQADPAVRARTTEALSAVLQFHGEALAAMLDRLAESEGGVRLIEALAGDERVSQMLLLHGLHPLEIAERVERALGKVRPYLASHGGHVELLDVRPGGEVRLRLEGSCHGCPSSRVTLKQTIEEAIFAAAPDVTEIHVEGAVAEEPPPPTPSADGFVQVSIHPRRLDMERSAQDAPLHATA
jgi:Fe-S cluster biogenesis protein NfuA